MAKLSRQKKRKVTAVGESKTPLFRNLGGRPCSFTDPEEMRAIINQYFIERDAVRLPYTIASVCIALGLNRDSFGEYETKPGFSDIIKNVRQILEDDKEAKTLRGEYNPAMAIFSLKHNHGWKDTQDVNVNASTEFFKMISDRSGNIEDGRIKDNGGGNTSKK